jgi:hypothetical protein
MSAGAEATSGSSDQASARAAGPGWRPPPAGATAVGPSPAERAACGKAARQRAPRTRHGEWEPAADRPDPVEPLEEQSRTRLPELIPIRYGRMWYLHLDRDLEAIVAGWAGRLTREPLRYFERNAAKARSKHSLRAFAKLTTRADGRPRIVHDPPLIAPIEALAASSDPERLDAAVQVIVSYYRPTLPRDRRRLLERYRYVHSAGKVVGVGSVGTRAWIMLMLGRDDGDPLLLQMKKAQESVLEPFLATPTTWCGAVDSHRKRSSGRCGPGC